MRVLVGDLGGTKSLLAVFELLNRGGYRDGGVGRVLHEERVDSRSFGGLEDLLGEFDFEGRGPVEAACFAVAGPVADGRCRTTNLPWELDVTALKNVLDLEHVALINDFVAVGYGLDLLRPDQILVLQEGEEEPQGPRAILGAGTGLGQAFALWDEQRYRVFPSEGGHVDFAPRNAFEFGLYSFLLQQLEHVSYDRVISGSGLVQIYRYLVASGENEESTILRAAMAHPNVDPAAIISEGAQKDSDPTCVRALQVFSSLYGAEAGNLALKMLATGGVYVAGGIAPQIADILGDGTFLKAFHDKGRFRSFMERLPVRVILEPRVGLLGAASVAAGLVEHRP